MALLGLQEASLRFGGDPLLDAVTFHIEQGDRIALLGANGAGKSSLLRLLAGDIPPDSGRVIRASGLRVGTLPQRVPADLGGPVLDIVLAGRAAHGVHSALGLSAERLVKRIGLDPSANFAALSGGGRRRTLLARALLGEPDLVLLDEPTNHLDIPSIEWLEAFLPRTCKTFLFVTHDRALLRRLANRIVELDRGRLRDWSCDYDTFLRRKEEELEAEEKSWAAQDRKLAQEEAWLRRGVKARRTRNEGRVRALDKLRAERALRRERIGTAKMSAQEAGRTGAIVAKVTDLAFSYDGKNGAPLIHPFSTLVARGDRVGILGPNGCGKSTLLHLLLPPDSGFDGVLAPTSGTVRHGTNLRVAYADQLRASLDDAKTLVETVADGHDEVVVDGSRRNVLGYLQDFLFPPERARQPVGALSGGERNRLLLARLFARPSNVLVLDEPTNDLDLDTLELLEEQLAAYGGTILVVSHDRAFLDNVVTSTLVFEKVDPANPSAPPLGPDDGWRVNEYAGGYSDWEARRPQPPAAEKPAARPRPAAPEKETPRRLAFKEKRELAELPARIEALEAEQAALHEKIADPAFYRDESPETVQAARDRLAALGPELEAACERWLVLGEIAAQN
ncbi:MAG: ATP-binding cassette domain-containing protein [Kiritimatiellia bacterium]|jgi:ATP-binding cassette subfamily F protein uup